MAIDPVCKMEVDEATAEITSEYQGQTYYFCAPGCKGAFESDPGKYLSGEAEEMPMETHGDSGGEAEGAMQMPESSAEVAEEKPMEMPEAPAAEAKEKKPWWKFW